MKIRRDYPCEIREELNVAIPLADGTRLAARLWRPVDGESHPVPAILEYIPYRQRDGTSGLDARTHPYFAGHGYAAIRVDIRGSGDSQGVLLDEYLTLEQDDALEIIAWVAAQPWCSGAVGMIGISWGGFAGLQIAARRPPALKAIVTVCSTDDRYADDVHYMGGCLLNDGISWGAGIFGVVCRPPDRDAVGEAWRDLWLQRLEANPVPLIAWMEHQRRDEFWRHGSVCEDYAAIDCAVYAVGGWTDGYTNAIFRLMQNLEAPKRALVGPWTHLYPHFGTPGPAIGFLQDCLRFWDERLKGLDRGLAQDPPIHFWMQEGLHADARGPRMEGRWCGLDAWPPDAGESRTLVLNPDRLEADARPEQALVVRTPLTCGLASGEWCPLDSGGEGPEFQMDQRADDALSLCFDSEPLTEPLEILGQPVLSVELSSDRPQAMLAVRLCEVAPDGHSSRVTFGLLNLCHRHGHAEPQALTPGERITVELPLKIVAYRFRPGHRIRLAVSTVYWPMAWPSPRGVSLSLFSGVSRLALPLCPAEQLRELDVPFEPAESSPPLPTTRLSESKLERGLSHDLATGAVAFWHEEESGTQRLEDIGLEVARKASEIYRIVEGDPLSARSEMRREVELRRGDWRVRNVETTVVSCDLETFRVEAKLEAFEGDRPIFERSWDHRIPRDQL